MIYINTSQCGGGLLSEELALFLIEVVLASSRIYSGAEHFSTEFPCGLFGKTNLVFVSCSYQTVRAHVFQSHRSSDFSLSRARDKLNPTSFCI